jgi:RsiW-degrading membrane proteinase PrsW (M82 family)
MVVYTALLYATLAACAVLVGWLAYRYDLYDREPVYMLVLAALGGGVTMWLAGRAQSAIIRATDDPELLLSATFFPALAAVTEELAKLSVVVVIALASRRHFNDPLDGLIYGSFAGLGAAIEESILVLGNSEHQFLPGTEPVRLAGHLIMGGIGAAGLGLFPLRRRGAVRWTAVTLAGAMGIHFLWDVVAFNAADTAPGGEGPRLGHTIAGIAIMLTGLVIFRRLITVGARHSKAAFMAGPADGDHAAR